MYTWFWGAWDSYWVGFYEAARRMGVVYTPAQNEGLDDWVTITRSSGVMYPFLDFCIITDRPEIIARNDGGRLHSETGPAMLYRDGYGLWAINGVRLTAQIVETPETLTAEQVRDEPNTEVRRHMLDRYAGLRGARAAGRWIEDMGLKPISELDITDKMQPSGLSIWRLSNPTAPVLCKLYRAELPDDEPLVLLWVVCTSTAKETFLRVPPTMADAATARAWTFGVEPAALEEAVET